MGDHPSSEEVAAYLSDGLDSEARLAFEAHIAECRTCRTEISSARRLLASGRSRKWQWVVPSSVRQSQRLHFSRFRRRGVCVKSQLERQTEAAPEAQSSSASFRLLNKRLSQVSRPSFGGLTGRMLSIGSRLPMRPVLRSGRQRHEIRPSRCRLTFLSSRNAITCGTSMRLTLRVPPLRVEHTASKSRDEKMAGCGSDLRCCHTRLFRVTGRARRRARRPTEGSHDR